VAGDFLTVDWPAPPGVHALVAIRGSDLAVAGLPAAPRWLKQVHGVAVADLDALSPTSEPVADAAVSARPGAVCVVRTADCLPVLLAAADGSAVAAAHAGWRGLAAGVVESTVAALRAKLAPGVALVAWLGPAIGPASFEVGEDVRAAFIAADPAAADAFMPGRPDRWQCDLYRIARQRLAKLGINDVSGGGLDTYADEARFHSHRRDVQHRGLDATGRMASFIWRQA
jgi:YfiH family protein